MKLSIIINTTFSAVLILSLVMDTIVLMKVKTRSIPINNKYYFLHEKFGFIPLSLVKIAVAGLIISGLFGATGKSGALLTIITGYVITVTNLCSAYRRRQV